MIKCIFVSVNILMLSLITQVYGGIICQTDWESLPIGPLSEYDPVPGMDRSARPFWGTDLSDTGGIYDNTGNPGKSAVAHIGPYTNDRSYAEPKFRFDSRFNGKQVYVEFDLKVDSDLGTSYSTREIFNLKIIRITDYVDAGNGSDDAWHPQINFTPSSSSYSLYTWSQGSGYSEYYFSRASIQLDNHLMDNDYHRIAIFIDIGSAVVSDRDDPSADGIVKIWEDGVLILEDNSVPFRTEATEGLSIKSMAFIRHAKSEGAPVTGMDGHLYFDNIIVRDDVPAAETASIVIGGTASISTGGTASIVVQ